MKKTTILLITLLIGLSTMVQAGRIYDPTIARFTTPDPALNEKSPQELLELQGGKLYTQSPYSYGYNNPLRYVDPDGKTPWDILDIGFAIWSVADFVQNPTWANFGWAALDVTAAALPIAPSSGYFRRGAQATDTAMDMMRGADKATDAAQGVRNSHLAGTVHPQTGIPFDSRGFPDFSGNLYKGGTNNVMIKPTGNRAADVAEANKAAGYSSTPEGYTWHHHQETGRMQLVESDIHRQTGHTGGFSLWQY